MAAGFVVHNLFYNKDNGFIVNIKNHPFLGHFCAYVYIPNTFEYLDEALEKFYLHGGITFGPCEDSYDDKDYTIFGCDYAHVGDAEAGWTLNKVINDVDTYINAFLNDLLPMASVE